MVHKSLIPKNLPLFLLVWLLHSPFYFVVSVTLWATIYTANVHSRGGVDSFIGVHGGLLSDSSSRRRLEDSRNRRRARDRLVQGKGDLLLSEAFLHPDLLFSNETI